MSVNKSLPRQFSRDTTFIFLILKTFLMFFSVFIMPLRRILSESHFYRYTIDTFQFLNLRKIIGKMNS